MKAKELEAMISIQTTEVSDNRTMFTAMVTLNKYCFVVNDLLQSSELAEIEVRKQLTEALMRDIYDDQRSKLYNALVKFMNVNPMDYTEIQKAREDLLEAALRQPEEVKK